MIIRQSVFARQCGVRPPSITEAIAKGQLVKTTDGKIDLDNPINASYLARHSLGSPSHTHPQHSPAPKDPPPSSAPPPTSPKPRRRPKRPDATAIIDAIRQGQAGADADSGRPDSNPQVFGDMTAAELQDLMRRGLYDAQKTKYEAELKAVKLAQEHGNLIDRDIVEGVILQFAQAIQQDFVSIVQKQAAHICKRLSLMGRESEVEDIITEDNDRRLQRIIKIVSDTVNQKYISPAKDQAIETNEEAE